MAKIKTIEERNKELALVGKKLNLYGLNLKLNPKQVQIEKFNHTFGCVRFVFNFFLGEKNETYKSTSKNLSYADFKKSFQTLKTHPLFSYLQEVDKFSLENSLMDVEKAFKNFFEGRARYPKFKKKHSSKQSYTTNMTNDNIKLDLNTMTIQLPKVGKVPFLMDKKLKAKLLANGLGGIIKSATITRHASGAYFASIKFEQVVDIQAKPDINLISDDEIVGIDLGLMHFAILSDGSKINNPKFYKRSLLKLVKMQRKLAKMQKGSHNYIKQRTKIAKLHLHIKNMRHDFLHKVSRKLVNENQVIVLEDLSVKNMIKNKKLSKSIQDVGWGMFKTFVKYKAEWSNKYVVLVDKFFPSSKLCGGCNTKNTLLSLSERQWVCPNCGTTHDRDINAAENIKKEGIRLLGINQPVLI